MLAHRRSACIAHITGQLSTRILGRSYTTTLPCASQKPSKTPTKENQPSNGTEIKGLEESVEPRPVIRRSAASLAIAEAKARAAALTQARMAKVKARAKARSTGSSNSAGLPNSYRNNRSNIPYGRKIWPGAPKNAVFVRTILPPAEPELIPTDRNDVPNTSTTTTEGGSKKGRKNKAPRQKWKGKWYLAVGDDVSTNPSLPPLPLLSSISSITSSLPPPPHPPSCPPQSLTRIVTKATKSRSKSPTRPDSVASFSPVWSSPNSPSITPSTNASSSSTLSTSAKPSSNSSLSSSLSSNNASETAPAGAVDSTSINISALNSNIVSSTAFSADSSATRSTKSRDTSTKAQEYERLWEAEFKNQRSFVIRNPSGNARSGLGSTMSSLSSPSALAFPPLSEVLSPPSTAHNIFPRLVSNAPKESPFQTSSTPSVLEKEIPSVELLDILVPPSANSKISRLSYTKSSLPQIPRRLPSAFRHPAFESLLSDYDRSSSIRSLSLPSEAAPNAAFEGKKAEEENSGRSMGDESIDKRPVVPFNVSDPNWSPSTTQIALLRAAAFKKDMFDPVRKPVLSTEGGPISRSKRRARYIAKKEDERTKKEIQAKVERERLAREERGLEWSERIKRRMEERTLRDAETDSNASSLSQSFPPPFQPPPSPRPVPPTTPSATQSSLSSFSSTNN